MASDAVILKKRWDISSDVRQPNQTKLMGNYSTGPTSCYVSASFFCSSSVTKATAFAATVLNLAHLSLKHEALAVDNFKCSTTPPPHPFALKASKNVSFVSYTVQGGDGAEARIVAARG